MSSSPVRPASASAAVSEVACVTSSMVRTSSCEVVEISFTAAAIWLVEVPNSWICVSSRRAATASSLAVETRRTLECWTVPTSARSDFTIASMARSSAPVSSPPLAGRRAR